MTEHKRNIAIAANTITELARGRDSGDRDGLTYLITSAAGKLAQCRSAEALEIAAVALEDYPHEGDARALDVAVKLGAQWVDAALEAVRLKAQADAHRAKVAKFDENNEIAALMR